MLKISSLKFRAQETIDIILNKIYHHSSLWSLKINAAVLKQTFISVNTALENLRKA